MGIYSVSWQLRHHLLFQFFVIGGCGLYGYLLTPVPSSHGLLLPGDSVVGLHGFLWHHVHWPGLPALRFSRVRFVAVFLLFFSRMMLRVWKLKFRFVFNHQGKPWEVQHMPLIS